MKLRHLILGTLAAVGLLAACQQEVNLGTPKVNLSVSAMTFEAAGGSQELTLNATRDWMVENETDWVVVSPESGNASAQEQKIVVTVLENKGMDRTASLKFTIGMGSKTLKVTQAGPGGSADALVLYSNDMNNGKVQKVGDYWPYPDQSDSWRNEKGSGIGNVKYTSNGVSVRSVSSTNNLWFPAKGGSYFSIQDIALNSVKSVQLTFDLVHGSPNGYKKAASAEVFKVYLSKDNAKWVELPYQLTVKADNEFDTASSAFALNGEENLSVAFKFLGAEDGYRLTNINLLVYEGSDAAAVDFSKAVEMDFGTASGSGSGGDLPEGTGDGTKENPYDAAKATKVASALGENDKVTGVYVKGVVKSVKEVSTQFGNATYYITDADGVANFYVYRGKNVGNTAFTSEDQIKVGDKVLVYGDLMNYMSSSPQLGQGNYIVEINGSSEGSEGGSTGGDLGKVNISSVIAAADNSTVEVEALVVATYSRGILLKDDTGYLLVYEGSKAPAAAGDKVNVKGTKTTYAGLAQIGSPAVTALSSGNTVTHPSPKVLDGAGMDAQLKAGAVEYVEYTGSLNVSGYYYNVNVTGASTAVGSLSYPAESLGLADLNGKEIKVTGYFIGVSSSKYINTMVTAVEATGNAGSGTGSCEGGSGSVDTSDATWSYTFASGDLDNSNVTLNGVAWTFVMNDSDYLGFDTSNGRGLQMGKKADPASSISLSTEGMTGTVKKIVVNTSGASGTDATLTVKVGGSAFGSPVNTTQTPTDYVFEGSASGKIELYWTLTTAAVYIKSISVYTE